MAYTEKQSSQLQSEQHAVVDELQNLQLQIVQQSHATDHPSVREHLAHGAARRVEVMKRSLQNIFEHFPPTATRLLAADKLSDVQINLQAFMINLYGVFDNLAWAFVFRHDLEAVIRDRRRIGLFNEKTTRHMPTVIRDYLSLSTTTEWHEKHLKSFRDALAHRIPLYIPPAEFTPEESVLYNSLETEKFECIKAKKYERLDQIYSEQTSIGVPSFVFLHSFSEGGPTRLVLIHPQVLSDARSVVELGTLFLKHWHERG